ncbi:MAG: DUF4421 domain-containing protein [Bacteroidota bacterium]
MICKQTALLIQRNILLLLLFCVCRSQFSQAQKTKTPLPRKEIVPAVRPFYYKDHDSSYYQSFERYITTRFFFSQKYARLELEKSTNVARLRYLPNTSLAMGVGVTYQSISLNVGYAFGFLNTDREKGRTRYLDIQPHIYGRKWVYDLTAQFYKGYYLNPRGFASNDPEKYYVRPDLRTQLLGLSAYRLLNPSKFSFRAALLENEQQRKSAGSVLIGAEIYYGIIKGDSAVVPATLENNYLQKGVRRLDFIKIGPGIGYAYTYVINRAFYLTGSLSASLSLDFSKQHGAVGKTDNVDINKGFVYRIVAGYDKNNWNLNFSLVGNQMTVAGATTTNKYLLSAGNFRLTVAKRIRPGSWLTRKLHPVDKVIENVKGLTPPKQ